MGARLALEVPRDARTNRNIVVVAAAGGSLSLTSTLAPQATWLLGIAASRRAGCGAPSPKERVAAERGRERVGLERGRFAEVRGCGGSLQGRREAGVARALRRERGNDTPICRLKSRARAEQAKRARERAVNVDNERLGRGRDGQREH